MLGVVRGFTLPGKAVFVLPMNSKKQKEVQMRKSVETDDVTLLDVRSNLQKYRLGLEAITELFEHKREVEAANLVRMIAEAMEVTEQMLQYISEIEEPQKEMLA